MYVGTNPLHQASLFIGMYEDARGLMTNKVCRNKQSSREEAIIARINIGRAALPYCMHIHR